MGILHGLRAADYGLRTTRTDYGLRAAATSCRSAKRVGRMASVVTCRLSGRLVPSRVAGVRFRVWSNPGREFDWTDRCPDYEVVEPLDWKALEG